MKRLFFHVLFLSGCAAPGPLPAAYYPPLPTKAEVRAEWKADYLAVACNLDAGTHFELCLSDDRECCEYMGAR